MPPKRRPPSDSTPVKSRPRDEKKSTPAAGLLQKQGALKKDIFLSQSHEPLPAPPLPYYQKEAPPPGCSSRFPYGPTGRPASSHPVAAGPVLFLNLLFYPPAMRHCKMQSCRFDPFILPEQPDPFEHPPLLNHLLQMGADFSVIVKCKVLHSAFSVSHRHAPLIFATFFSI